MIGLFKHSKRLWLKESCYRYTKKALGDVKQAYVAFSVLPKKSMNPQELADDQRLQRAIGDLMLIGTDRKSVV